MWEPAIRQPAAATSVKSRRCTANCSCLRIGRPIRKDAHSGERPRRGRNPTRPHSTESLPLCTLMQSPRTRRRCRGQSLRGLSPWRRTVFTLTASSRSRSPSARPPLQPRLRRPLHDRRRRRRHAGNHSPVTSITATPGPCGRSGGGSSGMGASGPGGGSSSGGGVGSSSSGGGDSAAPTAPPADTTPPSPPTGLAVASSTQTSLGADSGRRQPTMSASRATASMSTAVSSPLRVRRATR